MNSRAEWRDPKNFHHISASWGSYKLQTGDTWARLQYVLRSGRYSILHCETEKRLKLLQRLLSTIDCPHRHRLLFSLEDLGEQWGAQPNGHFFAAPRIYGCRYYSTLVHWRKEIMDPSKLCYSFDPHWRNSNKGALNPSQIFQSFPDYQFRRLSWLVKEPVENIIKELATCKLLVSLDNGMAHIARSVGCPHVLIRDGTVIEKHFPPKVYACHRAKNLQDANKHNKYGSKVSNEDA